jgi:hypothetical protein
VKEANLSALLRLCKQQQISLHKEFHNTLKIGICSKGFGLMNAIHKLKGVDDAAR